MKVLMQLNTSLHSSDSEPCMVLAIGTNLGCSILIKDATTLEKKELEINR